jgi:hypothetical protein
MSKFLLAVLEHEDNWDDGMISVKTGTVNSNGKNTLAVLNENFVLGVDVEKLKKLAEHWDIFCNSPEYPFIQRIYQAIQESPK